MITPRPEMSVIIPTFNRHASLRRTLASLQRQTLSSALFEIIVVDDGSSDDTGLMAREFPGIIFLQQEHLGPAAARNQGAARAQADLLVFIDDDCTAPPDWLEKIRHHFRNPDHFLVGGKSINALPQRFWSQVHQCIIDFWQRESNTAQGSDLFLTSNNLAIRKAVFERMEGFDQRFVAAGAEDRNLTRAVRAAGYPVDYCQDLVIHHHHDLTLRKFARQQSHYGQGSYILYSQTDWNGQRIPWFLLARLVKRAWSGTSLADKMKRFSAVLFSQVCVSWGFVTAAIEHRGIVAEAGADRRPTAVPALLNDLLPLFVSAGFLVFFGALNWAMVSRMLSHEQIGLLTSLLSLHLILWPVMNLCTSASMVRLAGSHGNVTDTGRVHLVFRTGVVTQLFISLLMGALLLAFSGTLVQILFRGRIPAIAIGLLIAGLVGMALYEFIFFIASVRLKFRTMAFMQIMLSAFRLIVLAACFLLWPDASLTMIFFIYMISYWIPFFLRGRDFTSIFTLPFQSGKQREPLFSLEISKKLIRYGSWVSSANVLASVNQYLGALLLLQFGQEREAGIFGLALMASAFIIVLVSAIQHYFLPYACRLQSRTQIQRFYRSSLKVTVPVVLAMGVMVLLSYFIFPAWFGEKGALVYPVFVLLSLAHLAGALFKPLYNIFHFLYKPFLINVDLAARLILLMPLALWLVPAWGALGMAAAQLGAVLLASILTFRLYRHQVRLRPHEAD